MKNILLFGAFVFCLAVFGRKGGPWDLYISEVDPS